MVRLVADKAFLEAVVLIIGVIATIGGGVYSNRQKINMLFQRLFGMDADPGDEGYIEEMNEKLDEIHEQMDGQHREMMNEVRSQRDDGDSSESSD